jgi:small subunit ribosomal protein S4
MKSIVNAKKKNSRRYGQNLWGDPNSPILKRNYAPGQHGQRRKKTTDYGEQLYAKQRLKVYYGNISEKQFYKYYEEAIRRRGDAAENLIGILESRLDNLVYRIGFASTRRGARQLVNHGHVTVNGKKVDIPSYRVKVGDVISLKEDDKNLKVVNESLEKVTKRVEFITYDENKKEATYVRLPERNELNADINEALIVEFYNK